MRYKQKMLQALADSRNTLEGQLPWLAAWDLYFGRGLFQEALLLKRLWCQSHVAELDELAPELSQLQALCWLGDYGRVEALISAASPSGNLKKLLPYLQQNIAVLQGDSTAESFAGRNRFASLVAGKQILLEGPGAFSEQGMPYQYDLRVAFNWLGDGDAPDIAYYSKENFTHNQDLIEALLAACRLKFAVVNGFNPAKLASPVAADVADRVLAPSPFLLGFHAPLLGVPRCLYDMISAGASGVYVSGADFYTRFPYHNDRYATRLTEIEQFLYSWAAHDLSFNYSLVQRLMKSGAVTGDACFTGALETDVESYFHKLYERLPK